MECSVGNSLAQVSNHRGQNLNLQAQTAKADLTDEKKLMNGGVYNYHFADLTCIQQSASCY